MPDIAQLKIDYNRSNIFIYLYIPEINLVLGEKQENLTKIAKPTNSLINDSKIKLRFNLIEVKKVYSCAQTVANLVASQIKNRLPFRSGSVIGYPRWAPTAGRARWPAAGRSAGF